MDRVCSPGLRQRLTLEESIFFFCSSSSTLSNPIPSSSSKKPERAREIHGEMERNEDIIEEAAAAAVAAEEEGMMAEVEKIYVAVSKDVKESKSALNWALQQCRGRKICLLHVHQPATMIPIMGGKFPANKLKKTEVKAYRDLERQKMNKSLNEYIDICSNVGVRVEKLQIELDNIEKGIVELVDQHGIKILVMGAAADKHYFKKMAVLRSKKAIFVCQQAHAQCRIWFVCKGYLILTREAVGTETGTSPSQILIPLTETSHAIGPRSLSEGNYVRLTNPVQDLFQSFQRVKSDGFYTRGGRSAALSSSEETRGTSISQRLSSEGSSSNEYKETSTRSPSQGSDSSIWSFGEVVGITDSISVARYEESEEAPHYSAQNEPEERKFIDEMDDQLRQAMAETEDSKREAFEESVRRRKAERYAIEAMSKAKASESLYVNAVKQKKEMEDALARETLSLKEMKTQQDDMMKELRAAQEQKLTLESQLAESNRAVKEMEEKIVSAVELLISFKKQRDEMQLERDNTVKEAEELRRRGESETSNSQRTQFLSEFPFMEIGEATRDFDPSLIIGEGGYGNVFRGMLRNTEVAIKMLHSSSLQGHSEFQQEVNILGRVRHPNLVTLIGTCPEASAIIYEYLPSGSLEDWLVCKNNTAPLSWQTRTRIAIEICSALIFLHSNKPHSIVHGDLKPANVLLDANLVSKLGDFGICRLITFDENSIKTTPFCKTSPKGTFVYMDPEFVSTGELTAKSDVYSFGVILLRLLTGKPAMGLVKEVEYALENGNLGTVLDASAGEWPFVQAKQLAHLALRCCEMNRRNRPDLVSEVWRVLEPLKASYGASPFWLGNEQDYGAPSYFLCPILQEIMQDPLVAADGFTYEAEALKGWLESGHDTSPMTNVKLTHRNLVPNHSLRSAIQEWLQKR